MDKLFEVCHSFRSIMKSVEFSFASSADETVDKESSSGSGSASTPDIISGSVSKQSLELLLLEKNKRLQNEAANLRNSNSVLQGGLCVAFETLIRIIGTDRNWFVSPKSLVETFCMTLYGVRSVNVKCILNGS